jgi:tetrahydromethanopterin S-methyltransferase subunit D
VGAGINPALTKKGVILDFLNIIFQSATEGINGILADGTFTAVSMIAILLVVGALFFIRNILVPSEEDNEDD